MTLSFRQRYALLVLTSAVMLPHTGCRSQLGSVYGVATGKTTAEDIIPPGVGRQPVSAANNLARNGASQPVTQASFAPPPSGDANASELQTAPVTTTVSNSLVSPTRDQAFQSVIGDLQQIGAANPQAQQELLRQLQTADPKHWDLIVRRFKSDLAYHQQLKSVRRINVRPAGHTGSHTSESQTSASHSTHRPALSASHPYPTTEASIPEVVVQATDPVDRVNRSVAKETANAIRLVGANAPADTVRPAVIENHAAMYEIEAKNQQPKDWREAVDGAIAALEAEAPTQPQTTGEAYLHARQRLLQLAAGNLDAAVEPIPGLSSTEQDYWSQQLFALSTLLDESTQEDVKRRAAAAGMHMGKAFASLQQLGSLSLRNLAFCSEVTAYGAYIERKLRRFKAGEGVALYVEVENYRTNKTSEGYQTVIGSSYKITDKSGNRVDGREFPAVDDLCLSPRRDFHIEYYVTLPERIYPGDYQLELTLTDQLGNKIGNAAIDFEIVEQ